MISEHRRQVVSGKSVGGTARASRLGEKGRKAAGRGGFLAIKRRYIGIGSSSARKKAEAERRQKALQEEEERKRREEQLFSTLAREEAEAPKKRGRKPQPIKVVDIPKRGGEAHHGTMIDKLNRKIYISFKPDKG